MKRSRKSAQLAISIALILSSLFNFDRSSGSTNTPRQPHSPSISPPTSTINSAVRMRLAGANPAPQLEGVDVLMSRSHYQIGSDPDKWRRNLASYGKMRYRGVYLGIDLIYYGKQRQLEYDFLVAAGADPSAIEKRQI